MYILTFNFAGLNPKYSEGDVVELVNVCMAFVEDVETACAKLTGQQVESG